MLMLLILAVIFICIIEIIPLVKKGSWKELAVYCSILALAVLLLLGKKLELPTPIKLMYQIVSPIGKIIFTNY